MKKIALLLAFFAIGLNVVLAQTKEITGKVTSADDGGTMPGVSISVKGTSIGTITDMDGNFSIKVKPGSKLKVTYIGFDDQIVSAKNGMKVTMKEGGAVSLKAVEVVAYGVQKKVTVTGALSSIKSEDLLRTPVASVNDVLAGQLSGVTTVQYSGEPGANSTNIFVRGQGTWVDSKPLIQVDGVERDM